MRTELNQEDVQGRVVELQRERSMSASAFARLIGIDPANYSRKIKFQQSWTRTDIRKISDSLGLSELWLKYGIGDKYLDYTTNTKLRTYTRRVGIPLVSQYAQAGYLTGYGDQEYIESLPVIDFTPDREMTGNWLAFEVRGDSMDDGTKHGYEQGEIVICREVEPYLYKDSRLHFNQRDFVIVHEEGILLKRVIEHDVEHHTIVIHSLNPEYPDRTLDLAQVRQIFSVVESRMQRKR